MARLKIPGSSPSSLSNDKPELHFDQQSESSTWTEAEGLSRQEDMEVKPMILTENQYIDLFGNSDDGEEVCLHFLFFMFFSSFDLGFEISIIRNLSL